MGSRNMIKAFLIQAEDKGEVMTDFIIELL